MTPRPERGAAVVDFVLVMVLAVPLLLGVIQLGLVLHVRNTLTAAASEGARHAAAYGRRPEQGVERTRAMIDGALAETYAQHVVASPTTVRGQPGVVVEVRAEVPALGLFGPAVELEVDGHAVAEVVP